MSLSLAVQSRPFYEGLVSIHDSDREWLSRTSLPLFPWSSQARGFFSGQFRPEAVQAAIDAGEANEGFARRMLEVYGTDKNLERLCRAERLGQEKGGYSAVQIALAWLVHQPFEVFPIVGPHTPGEIASCIAALEISLSEEEAKWLDLGAADID